ncbi:MAG: universal stress protein [Gomphosphaeria aponina SAG 52.96 = DSM 107014]|uniref:Universal stress protein n=1 Tax=Gomphosphaeria aponina SAG 52.96 = DSM 107014 TaxID=1521640 RepID=A0A941GSV7_9CHRO|nr:universal stress protein [Gomphosphaeria aponina SAG 52.96 = DSM 107014]
MLKTIVVGLDCEEFSERVIKTLQTLHLNSLTKIILCHVLPTYENYGLEDGDKPHPSWESLYQHREQQLKAYLAQLQGSVIEIVAGDPAEEIIRLANIYQADLIVIGTRGLKGFKRIIESSVSGQVVTDASCSVLVVK